VGLVAIVLLHLSVLAGGVFRLVCSNVDCHMYPDPKALATLELFFTVCAISFPLLWTFSISRKLPKRCNNLDDGINRISQSRLFDDDTFADLGSRDDPIYRLKLARGLYYYGVTTGRDGKQHLTVDRVAEVKEGIKQRQSEKALENFQYSGNWFGRKYQKWKTK